MSEQGLPVPRSREESERLREVYRAGWVGTGRLLGEDTRATAARLFPAPVGELPELEFPYAVGRLKGNASVEVHGFYLSLNDAMEARRNEGTVYRLAVVEVISPEREPVVATSGRSFRVKGGKLETRWHDAQQWDFVLGLSVPDACDPKVQALLATLTTEEK